MKKGETKDGRVKVSEVIAFGQQRMPTRVVAVTAVVNHKIVIVFGGVEFLVGGQASQLAACG